MQISLGLVRPRPCVHARACVDARRSPACVRCFEQTQTTFRCNLGKCASAAPYPTSNALSQKHTGNEVHVAQLSVIYPMCIAHCANSIIVYPMCITQCAKIRVISHIAQTSSSSTQCAAHIAQRSVSSIQYALHIAQSSPHHLPQCVSHF